MSLMIQLSPEQEARLRAMLGDDANISALVERLLAAFTDTLPSGNSVSPLPQASRTPGLGQGEIVFISADFDEPLGDEFWLGAKP